MNWTHEVVVVPVSGIDHDIVIGENVRIVQLTPPGSSCSIMIGKGTIPNTPPGSLKGFQLVVNDIHKAHAELVGHGVEVSEVTVMGKIQDHNLTR